MHIILFFLLLAGIGGITAKLVIDNLSKKSKGLNSDKFKQHTENLAKIDKEINRLESQGIKNYANSYVWDKFKTSPLTIFGLAAPLVASLTIFSMDVPFVTNIFSALLGLGLLGLAFWWYRIFKVYDYAKVGSEKFLKLLSAYKDKYVTIEYNKIKSAIRSLKKTTEHTMQADSLLGKFSKEYDDLIDVINKQQIINADEKTTMLKDVDNAFKEGISLFKEIFDVLLVEDKIDHHSASKAILERSELNQTELRELFGVLEKLIESFSLTTLDIPQATSSKRSVDVAKSAMSKLQNSMNQAKQVQENVREMSYSYSASGNKLDDIASKYN